jgi:ABC-type nitrate/sulfonate/bicarbonate transport system ATPase subunit
VLTRRPARIKAEVAIDLERPRTHEVLTSAEFVEKKRRVLQLLLDETRPLAQIGQRRLGVAPEASRTGTELAG